jgi:hypothetical protein
MWKVLPDCFKLWEFKLFYQLVNTILIPICNEVGKHLFDLGQLKLPRSTKAQVVVVVPLIQGIHLLYADPTLEICENLFLCCGKIPEKADRLSVGLRIRPH